MSRPLFLGYSPRLAREVTAIAGRLHLPLRQRLIIPFLRYRLNRHLRCPTPGECSNTLEHRGRLLGSVGAIPRLSLVISDGDCEGGNANAAIVVGHSDDHLVDPFLPIVMLEF